MNSKSILNSSHLSHVLEDVVEDLIDSFLMDGVLAMHRAIKLGYFHVIAPEPDTEDELGDATSVARVAGGNSTGRDNSAKLASGFCRCVKCHTKVAATRFAVHLSNCMGLGRNSSRRANKRIAEQQRLEDYAELDDDFEEFVRESVSTRPTLQPSASDPAIIPNSSSSSGQAKQQQYSPLKLTISLVPNGTSRTDVNAKHVIRAVNGEPISDMSHNHILSESPKKMQKLSLAKSGRSISDAALWKDSKMTLINQGIISYKDDK